MLNCFKLWCATGKGFFWINGWRGYVDETFVSNKIIWCGLQLLQKTYWQKRISQKLKVNLKRDNFSIFTSWTICFISIFDNVGTVTVQYKRNKFPLVNQCHNNITVREMISCAKWLWNCHHNFYFCARFCTLRCNLVHLKFHSKCFGYFSPLPTYFYLSFLLLLHFCWLCRNGSDKWENLSGF